MSPHVPFEIDEFAYRNGVGLLERAGIKFVEERSETFDAIPSFASASALGKFSEHASHIKAGRIEFSGRTYQARFQSCGNSYTFFLTMAGDGRSLAETVEAIELAFGGHFLDSHQHRT